MSVTIFQLQKRSSDQYKNIQDKYAFNPDTATFALADGTTQSYNSEIWAELITHAFVEQPTFEPAQLIELFKKCVQAYRDHTPSKHKSCRGITAAG